MLEYCRAPFARVCRALCNVVQSIVNLCIVLQCTSEYTTPHLISSLLDRSPVHRGCFASPQTQNLHTRFNVG